MLTSIGKREFNFQLIGADAKSLKQGNKITRGIGQNLLKMKIQQKCQFKEADNLIKPNGKL
jgi:hypothetical protein